MNRLRISWIYGVLFLVLSLSASAQPDWTRIGSTGTVDESTPFQVNGPALFHPVNSLTSVVARFNVDNVSGQFPLAPWNVLEMTSQDGTTQGQVTARLMRVPRCTGTPILVCAVQSSDTALGPTCTQCTFTPQPDFANNSYYVEVTISRSVATVTPALFSLRLF